MGVAQLREDRSESMCVPLLPVQFTVSVLFFSLSLVTRGLRQGDDGARSRGCTTWWHQS